MNIVIERVDKTDMAAMERLARGQLACRGRIDHLMFARGCWLLGYPTWQQRNPIAVLGMVGEADGFSVRLIELAVHKLTHHFDAGAALVDECVRLAKARGFGRVLMQLKAGVSRRNNYFAQAGFVVRPVGMSEEVAWIKDLT